MGVMHLLIRNSLLWLKLLVLYVLFYNNEYIVLYTIYIYNIVFILLEAQYIEAPHF